MVADTLEVIPVCVKCPRFGTECEKYVGWTKRKPPGLQTKIQSTNVTLLNKYPWAIFLFLLFQICAYEYVRWLTVNEINDNDILLSCVAAEGILHLYAESYDDVAASPHPSGLSWSMLGLVFPVKNMGASVFSAAAFLQEWRESESNCMRLSIKIGILSAVFIVPWKKFIKLEKAGTIPAFL